MPILYALRSHLSRQSRNKHQISYLLEILFWARLGHRVLSLCRLGMIGFYSTQWSMECVITDLFQMSMNNLINFIKIKTIIIYSCEIFILREKNIKMKALVPVILMASVIDADQIPVKMIFKSKPRSVFTSEPRIHGP